MTKQKNTNGEEHKKAPQKTEGFTLVELAIVLIISTFFILIVAALYKQYIIERRIQITKDHISAASEQIARSFPVTLSYPCPADRSIQDGEDGYLEEFDPNCDIMTLVLTEGSSPGGAGTACSITGYPGGGITAFECYGCTEDRGICVVPGTRDIDETGVIGDTFQEVVVIGALPTRTMREQRLSASFSDDIAFDGYGNMMTYAVTLGQASDGLYEFDKGMINVVDEHGQQTAGMNNDAHYVLISHGPNGVDLSALDCGLDSPEERANCDYDSTFVQAIQKSGADANFYDDTLLAMRSSSVRLWSNIQNSSSITNLNTANIGINLPVVAGVPQLPQEMLHIGGNLRAEGTVRAKAIRIDSAGGDIVFNSDTFVTEKLCGANQGVTRIDLSGPTPVEQLGCENISYKPITDDVDCSPGWIHGIYIDGTVECFPNPSPPATFSRLITLPGGGVPDPGGGGSGVGWSPAGGG